MSAIHLAATLLVVFDWGGGAGSSDVLRHDLMLPLYAAARYRLAMGVSEAFKLFVLLPINSILYGAALSAIVLAAHRLLRRPSAME